MTHRFPDCASLGALSLFACSLLGSGCYSTLDIPFREATSLRRGAVVHTHRGIAVEADELSTVEPVPPNGTHYEQDAEGLHARPGFEPATDWSVSAPVTVTKVEGRLVFAGADRKLSIAERDVVRVRARRYDEGKTAAVVTGVVGGAVLVGTLIAVAVISANAGSGSHSCASGWCGFNIGE
jgi:hypothetical protein